MGLLVEGRWQQGWLDTDLHGGQFKRQESSFREWVRADGTSRFPAEPGRYHLYVSYACPWAHRVLIVRKLKRLESVIGLSVVHPVMGDDGWTFNGGDGCTGDRINGRQFLREVYTVAEPRYTGRVTVPVLWDTKLQTIVNNESSEILRMLNSEFDAFGDDRLDLYPEELRPEIDQINALVYQHVNNGVYKAGFATTQVAYEAAVGALFKALDTLEDRLGLSRYLCGDRLTEADWRLFTTLLRFDTVYVTHFKCNLRRIIDYPNLQNYLKELYQQPGVSSTVHMDHIKGHYFQSHGTINPNGLVPVGPVLDLDSQHDRARLS